MKERPILFKPHEVTNTLSGRQTQFRRVVKNRSNCPDFYAYEPSFSYPYCIRRKDGCWDSFKTIEELAAKYCPYGQVGDRLWAKETWLRGIGPMGESFVYAYRATDPEKFGPWKPSIHMPREASRIILEITGVRVERLQDISEEDAIAEGIEIIKGTNVFKNYQIPYPSGWFYPHRPIDSFRTLWDSINAKKHPWANNDWVWVVDYVLAKSTMAIAAKEESQ